MRNGLKATTHVHNDGRCKCSSGTLKWWGTLLDDPGDSGGHRNGVQAEPRACPGSCKRAWRARRPEEPDAQFLADGLPNDSCEDCE